MPRLRPLPQRAQDYVTVGQKSPGRSYFSPRFDDNKEHWYSGYLNTSQTLPVKIFFSYGGEEAAGTSGAEPRVLSQRCKQLGQLDIELNEHHKLPIPPLGGAYERGSSASSITGTFTGSKRKLLPMNGKFFRVSP
ncbi:ribosomal RNA large subunit methyltransferase E [Striga asiatica]|uniref:Ribosomal RNA large subunit methyltransferase E n=1 Tax=Striga asiatica TaxID=4170 RepID=A0A5A7Q2H0_STRAF|nr:ribosomal RNA large subunit methyltransferase E [Striga asiatica]